VQEGSAVAPPAARRWLGKLPTWHSGSRGLTEVGWGDSCPPAVRRRSPASPGRAPGPHVRNFPFRRTPLFLPTSKDFSRQPPRVASAVNVQRGHPLGSPPYGQTPAGTVNDSRIVKRFPRTVACAPSPTPNCANACHTLQVSAGAPPPIDTACRMPSRICS